MQKLSTFFVCLILGTQLLFYTLIMCALLWEAWTQTPTEQAQRHEEWENRDNLTEEQKQELRSRYMLLMLDNIPDNEPQPNENNSH